MIKLGLSEDCEQLVVTTLNENHNHEVSQVHAAFYFIPVWACHNLGLVKIFYLREFFNIDIGGTKIQPGYN